MGWNYLQRLDVIRDLHYRNLRVDTFSDRSSKVEQPNGWFEGGRCPPLANPRDISKLNRFANADLLQTSGKTLIRLITILLVRLRRLLHSDNRVLPRCTHWSSPTRSLAARAVDFTCLGTGDSSHGMPAVTLRRTSLLTAVRSGCLIHHARMRDKNECALFKFKREKSYLFTCIAFGLGLQSHATHRIAHSVD